MDKKLSSTSNTDPQVTRIITIALVVLVTIIVVNVAIGFYNNSQNEDGGNPTPAATPTPTESQSENQPENNISTELLSPANTINNGFVFNKDGLKIAAPQDMTIPVETKVDPNMVSVTVYYDYECSFCTKFFTANYYALLDSPQVDEVILRPISFLNENSANTANFMFCVAESKPKEFKDILGKQLTTPNEAGAPDKLKADQNLTPEESKCIQEGKHKNFVTAITEKALNEPIVSADGEENSLQGVPTILVNGYLYEQDPSDSEEFMKMVKQVSDGTYVPSTKPVTP